MYIRRHEGDVEAFLLVVISRKIVGASDSLRTRKPGGSNVSVAVIPLAPRSAAIGCRHG